MWPADGWSPEAASLVEAEWSKSHQRRRGLSRPEAGAWLVEGGRSATEALLDLHGRAVTGAKRAA